MSNDHEARRADTIPELDRKTTGNSVNSRSGEIGDTVHEDAKRMDRRYAEDGGQADTGRGHGGAGNTAKG